MKKILTYLFLIFLSFQSQSFAKDFVYNCNLTNKFKNGIDGDWKQKYLKLTFSSLNNTKVKVFDHEINLYYEPSDLTIMVSSEKFIYAAGDMFGSLGSLSINKKTKYTQFTILNSSGGTNVHFGFCK
tara:strand:+ start:579 stop:959 length:381 start_codon:yes stop_codon:yes gene_type:complete